MKYLIPFLLYVYVLIPLNSIGQSASSGEVNINQLAPHLPLLQSTTLSKAEQDTFRQQLKDWQEQYYKEFDAVRSQVIAILLDKEPTRLSTTVKGEKKDAFEVYHLKGWEMDYGLSDQEWEALKKKIDVYREENSSKR